MVVGESELMGESELVNEFELVSEFKFGKFRDNCVKSK